MAIMAILVFAPKRTTAAIAVLSVCIFMPMAQRVVVGGLDFPMSRLIAIMVALRVLIKGQHRSFAMGKLDRLVLYWVLSGSVVGVLRVGMSGVVPSLGHSFDVLASYLIVRILVRTPGEVLSVWKQVAWIVIVLSPLLVLLDANSTQPVWSVHLRRRRYRSSPQRQSSRPGAHMSPDPGWDIRRRRDPSFYRDLSRSEEIARPHGGSVRRGNDCCRCVGLQWPSHYLGSWPLWLDALGAARAH